MEKELDNLLPVKEVLRRIKGAMNFWSGEQAMGVRLGLRLSDCDITPSPGNWDVKTSDSTWSVTYRVKDHVFDFSGNIGDSRFRYPDWVWYDSDPPNPRPSALVTLMRSGFPDTFPLGEISGNFYRNGFSRLHDHLVEADNLSTLLRKLFDLWPV